MTKHILTVALIAAALVIMILVLPTIGGGNPIMKFG